MNVVSTTYCHLLSSNTIRKVEVLCPGRESRKSAAQVLDGMEKHAISPNGKTFSAAMSACCDREWPWALELLQKMDLLGILLKVES